MIEALIGDDRPVTYIDQSQSPHEQGCEPGSGSNCEYAIAQITARSPRDHQTLTLPATRIHPPLPPHPRRYMRNFVDRFGLRPSFSAIPLYEDEPPRYNDPAKSGAAPSPLAP